ncbi:MAG: family 1 encapsulin nanocompartment shell protein [Bradymonadaceae bacterium]
MEGLMRHLAPISGDAWEMIDEEAVRVLERTATPRRLLDFSGPHGWQKSAVNLGRSTPIDEPPVGGAQPRLRESLPLVEIRVPFELDRRELEDIDRGAKDPDLEPVARSARMAAEAEGQSIFNGYDPAGIEGILDAAHDQALALPDDYVDYPVAVAEATDDLRSLGVDGPYAVALGPDAYTGVTKTTHSGGFPIIEHIDDLLDGPVVWTPSLDGGVVLSQRGGDFELTVGRDFCIGYLDHTASAVRFFVEETFTFRVLGEDAAIPLEKN